MSKLAELLRFLMVKIEFKEKKIKFTLIFFASAIFYKNEVLISTFLVLQRGRENKIQSKLKILIFIINFESFVFIQKTVLLVYNGVCLKGLIGLYNDFQSTIKFFIYPILRQQYGTFLFCSPFSYRSSNFAIAKLSLLKAIANSKGKIIAPSRS